MKEFRGDQKLCVRKPLAKHMTVLYRIKKTTHIHLSDILEYMRAIFRDGGSQKRMISCGVTDQ